jgi:glutamate-1-semialdehyde 2,1-aminomutase
MLEHGILLPPSPYEAWFLSTEHDDATITRILEAVDRSL